MARSHRDYVNAALETLAAGLEPFIARTLAPLLPQGADGDWTILLALRDESRNRRHESYLRTDSQIQLRVMTESMGGRSDRPFNGVLSRNEQNWASELRDVRNRWAHNEPFTADQARRALDTAELLLRAVGAPPQADEVKAMRLELQRAEYERDTRRTVRRSAVVGTADGELPAWREVLPPHPDVAEGRFASSEFAANLFDVAFPERGAGSASAEYTDPVEFFRRTYLTSGLRELLRRSVARVGGDSNADGVINLQTTFGGGKTHSMLAVWHLFAGLPVAQLPQEVQDVLAGGDLDAAAIDTALAGGIRRVAIVGNEIAPGQPETKPDGTVVRTLWGELAWQLGGADGYALVAEADRTGTNPGSALRTLLGRYAPAVILVDEWVAYARGLNARVQHPDGSSGPLPAGDFETQFTFAQTLTEAVQATPGALLLVSIPASPKQDDGDTEASDLEVGGAFGREAVRRLDNVVRRVAYQWAHASQDEAFEIVRRRLFEPLTDERQRAIAAAARRFAEFYQKHAAEFPADAGTAAYEARIRAAYPMHPELLDRLYSEWSTLEKFQRTRGVLRLMSAVVHQLWAAADPAPLILPGSVPLAASPVRREVVQYLPSPAWDAIVQADIDSDGEGAVPVARAVDADRPLLGERALTVRTARAVFVQSAPTAGNQVKGIDRKRLLLGLAQPGDVVGNIGSALQALADRSTHFYVADGRYWYDTQKSLNREAAERARHLPVERVYEEVVRRLKAAVPRVTPEFTAIVVAPESTSDILESDAVRLVIVHPRYRHTNKDMTSPAAAFALDALRTRGSASRAHPNTLILLAPDARRWDELESTVRSFLAWESIGSEHTALDLAQSAVQQVERNVLATDQTVTEQILGTWTWGLHATQPVANQPLRVGQLKCDGGKEKRLAQRTGARFVREDQLRVTLAPELVRMDLDDPLRARWNLGQISVAELWGYYAKYPYLPRLRDRSVLEQAVQDALFDSAFMDRGFALAAGYNEQTGVFEGLAIPLEDTYFGAIQDDTLLVRPDLAVGQRQRERAAAATSGADDGTAADPGTSRPAGSQPALPQSAVPGTTTPGRDILPEPPRIRNTRYKGSADLRTDGDLRATATQLVDELLVHLQRADPDVLEITVDVLAEKSDGFTAHTVRIVRENGPGLGVDGTFQDG